MCGGSGPERMGDGDGAEAVRIFYENARTLKHENCGLSQGIVKIACQPIGNRREPLARVFEKMRRLAVGFERSVILVLLVNEEARSVILAAMDLIHQASRLFARFSCQLDRKSVV